MGGCDIVLEMATGGELKEVLVAAEAGAAGAGAAVANAVVPINDRIKFLLNSSKVMLFMKGDREEPRCGYGQKSGDRRVLLPSILVNLIRNPRLDFELHGILRSGAYSAFHLRCGFSHEVACCGYFV